MLGERIRILGIPGSLRKRSYNKLALRAAQQLVPDGATIEIFELDGIPPFNEDEERQPPPRVVDLKARLGEVDAVLFATPEYNYSVPGVLKNAIDWASRPNGQSAWSGKPVAVMGASPGLMGTVRAQHHLRQAFVFLEMPVVLQPQVLIGSAAQRFDDRGELTDEMSRKLIRQLLEGLIRLTHAIAQPATTAGASTR
jgi:chromate reductase, NAD(P)H dehydrogenase (quinone)